MAIHRHFTKKRRFATKMSKKMNAHAGTLNFRAMEKQPRAQIEEKYVEIKYHRGEKNGKMEIEKGPRALFMEQMRRNTIN